MQCCMTCAHCIFGSFGSFFPDVFAKPTRIFDGQGVHDVVCIGVRADSCHYSIAGKGGNVVKDEVWVRGYSSIVL